MPRWSINPSWSSAKAPQGSSTWTGPVECPLGALRWSMVMQRKSSLNSSMALNTAVGQPVKTEFKPPPGVAKSGNPDPSFFIVNANVASCIVRHGSPSWSTRTLGLRRL